MLTSIRPLGGDANPIVKVNHGALFVHGNKFRIDHFIEAFKIIIKNIIGPLLLDA